jgi:hypothetical protein
MGKEHKNQARPVKSRGKTAGSAATPKETLSSTSDSYSADARHAVVRFHTDSFRLKPRETPLITATEGVVSTEKRGRILTHTTMAHRVRSLVTLTRTHTPYRPRFRIETSTLRSENWTFRALSKSVNSSCTSESTKKYGRFRSVRLQTATVFASTSKRWQCRQDSPAR